MEKFKDGLAIFWIVGIVGTIVIVLGTTAYAQGALFHLLAVFGSIGMTIWAVCRLALRPERANRRD